MNKHVSLFTVKLTQLGVLCFLTLLSLAPYIAFAQYYDDKSTLQGYIALITDFIGWTLLPLIFGIALLFFLVNAARYFVLGGDKSEGRDKAKMLALYGLGAFVFLISIWGIVNMFVNGLGIDDNESMCPDYLEDWCGSSSNYNNSGFDAYRSGYDTYQFDAYGNGNDTFYDESGYSSDSLDTGTDTVDEFGDGEDEQLFEDGDDVVNLDGVDDNTIEQSDTISGTNCYVENGEVICN